MKILSSELFPVRLASYMVVVGLAFQSIVLMVKNAGWEEVAREGGPLERIQAVLIATTALILGVQAYRARFMRPLFAILTIAAGTAFIREFNNASWYKLALPEGWMKTVAALVVASVVIIRCRGRTWQPFLKMLPRPSAIMFVFGFGTVTLLAQALAQKELWPGRYDRLLEESLELAGYVFIFFGALEILIEARTHRDPLDETQSASGHRKQPSATMEPRQMVADQ